MTVPLTIENFEIHKLRAKAPESKKSGNVTYFAIPIEYEDGEPLIKLEGNFRVMKHENTDGINYSLAISIDDENEEFFSELGQTIAELACEWKTKIFSRLKHLKPSDLELVKSTSNGKYKNVYAKIYANKSGKVNCKLSERMKVHGIYKKKRIGIDDLVDESFKGSCLLRVYRAYVGSSKMITLSVEEYMVTDMATKKSYFDECEEIKSDESSSEGAD